MTDRTAEETGDYVGKVVIRSSRERVFDSVATVRGLRGWWTPIVTGAASAGEELTFGFEDLDETIVMRVDETVRPTHVHWTCIEHTSVAEWAGTRISFEVSDSGPDFEQCVLVLRHAGVAAGNVAAGWDRFLASLTGLVETGDGQPYGAVTPALEAARAYHAAWTSHDFEAARRHLAEGLQTEVPINTYAGPDDFADAVARFGALAERVDLLAEFGHGDQALLLYDMHAQPIGTLRVAEHFTVDNGLIRRIRQVHDTVALRSTG